MRESASIVAACSGPAKLGITTPLLLGAPPCRRRAPSTPPCYCRRRGGKSMTRHDGPCRTRASAHGIGMREDLLEVAKAMDLADSV